MKNKLVTIITVFLVAVMMLTGCSGEVKEPVTTTTEPVSAPETTDKPSNTPEAPTSTPEAEEEEEGVYAITINLNGEEVAKLTLEDLLPLEQVTFQVADKSEEGPTVRSALALAGIEDFTQLTAHGLTKGRVATAEMTLMSKDIDESVILDITNKGTCKLAGADIPDNDWIIDVNQLDIE